MEKRAFIRLDTNVRVYWKLIVETTGVLGEFPDVSKDISAGGICLVMNERLMIGDKVEMGIELPSERIEAKGRVVWIRESEIDVSVYRKMYHVGVEFTEIREDDREEINKYVSEYIYANKED